jgi:hypothetical protein
MYFPILVFIKGIKACFITEDLDFQADMCYILEKFYGAQNNDTR